jgi:uncharacterized membrane protein
MKKACIAGLWVLVGITTLVYVVGIVLMAFDAR